MVNNSDKNIQIPLLYKFKKHLSDTTSLNADNINRQLIYVEMFLEYYKEKNNIANILDYDNISANDITFFLNEQRDIQKNAVKTLNIKLRAIKKFFTYLNDNGYTNQNVSLYVKYYKCEDKEPVVIPHSDLKKIMDYMYEDNMSLAFITITKMSAYMGLTLHEIFNLKIDAVNQVDRKLSLYRDNSKYTFPIPNTLYPDLKEYISYRKVNNPKEIDSLFISSTGNPYSLRTYQAAFKELLIKCNIENKYSPRNLRSTFLKEMAKKVPLSELKAISNQEKLKQYYKI